MNRSKSLTSILMGCVAIGLIQSPMAAQECEITNPLADVGGVSSIDGRRIDVFAAAEEWCRIAWKPTSHAYGPSIKRRYQPTKDKPYPEFAVTCYTEVTNPMPGSPACRPETGNNCEAIDGTSTFGYHFNYYAPFCDGSATGAWGCGGGDGYWRCPIIQGINFEKKYGQCGAGNPIDPVSGQKFQRESDISLPGGLGFSRLYLPAVGRGISKRALVGSDWHEGFHAVFDELGNGWRGTYASRLFLAYDVGSVELEGREVASGGEFTRPIDYFYAVRSSGQSHLFQTLDGLNYASTPDLNDRFVVDGSGYLYRDTSASAFETYEGNHRVGWKLKRITRANGSTITVDFDSSTMRMTGIRDDFGRQLIIRSNALNGRIEELQDPEGGVIRYEHSGDLLTAVYYQDGATKKYLYDEPAFSSSAYSPRLTGMVDELNRRVGTYWFRQDGRATATEGANALNRFSLSYNTAFNTTITDPLGASRTISFSPHWGAVGVQDIVSNSQPAGSGCAASTSSMSYDANGNLVQRDDFNGSRVCSSYELNRNLEDVRVEGMASTQDCSAVTASGATLPAGSRKISSQWHPDWRLETKVAEPKRITTTVYNGQPDPFSGNAIASCAPSTALLPDGRPIVVMCKKVEQATTDANGGQGFAASQEAGVANRVWQWTYNQYGQVLTERDPLNNLTTTTYYADTTADHTLGDRQRVINAKGHVTNYTKYNKHGQLLEAVDPNGVVTAYTYDLRQRLTSVSISGQTTGYTYDPAGQLTRVTLPDASWVGYEYDDAHRQVAVLDSRGNRIEYTLDNAGNRIAENVKDPSGVLARELTRTIDALGRVQQTTGRN